MKMITYAGWLATTSLLSLALSAQAASTTLVFLTGDFADSTGAPKNAMPFGLVVDTAGDGFGAYFADVDTQLSGYLNSESIAYSPGLEDDDYFLPGGLTENTFVFEGGQPVLKDGVISTISEVPLDGPLNTGMAFGLIWFESNLQVQFAGLRYGLQTPGVSLPAGGSTVSFEGLFSGAAALLTLAIVPEPGWAALLLGAVLPLLRLFRHRKAA